MAELQNENRNKTHVKRLCHRKICRAVGSPAPLRFRVSTALIWTMLLYLKATSVVVLQFKRKRLLYTNEKTKNPKNILFEFKSRLENINSSKKFKQEDRFYGKILLVSAAAAVDLKFLLTNFCLKKHWQFTVVLRCRWAKKRWT